MKMLVLCGTGHAAYGLGLPARVLRRLPGTRGRIVLLCESGELRLSPEEKAQARPIEITHEQLREIKQPVADYLCAKPLAAEPPEARNYRPSWHSVESTWTWNTDARPRRVVFGPGTE